MVLREGLIDFLGQLGMLCQRISHGAPISPSLVALLHCFFEFGTKCRQLEVATA